MLNPLGHNHVISEVRGSPLTTMDLVWVEHPSRSLRVLIYCGDDKSHPGLVPLPKFNVSCGQTEY